MLEMDFCPCFQYSLCWTCWRDGEKLFECTTHMKMPEQWWELLFWLNILLFFILGLQGYSASLNWFDGLAGKNAMTFFFCWIIYRWKISALLDLTQKALKCFLQPDLTLFSTFCLASKKTWFSQIWIFFFSSHFFPSGLGSETIICTALFLIATICLDCTAMSLAVLLLATLPGHNDILQCS